MTTKELVQAWRIDTSDDAQKGHYCFVAARTEREARETFDAWMGAEYRIQEVSGPFQKDRRVVMNG